MEIGLPTGERVLFDDSDYELVQQYRWFASPRKHTTYAYAFCGPRKTITMHRLLMGAPSGLDVDHKNHNGLDNRRANLRLGSRAENLANSFNREVNTSGYKGVSWIKAERKWVAGIKIDGRRRVLGRFLDLWEAAQAYNEAARAAWGEFAYQNEKKKG